jgi:hypothetical protein
MNWQQFKKNAGMLVQIEPPACQLDINSHALSDQHDDWIIEFTRDEDVVSLRNTRTQKSIKLGKDHIYDFRSNPNHADDTNKHGFLILKVQIFSQRENLWLRPNARPGERINLTGLAHHQLQWTPFTEVDASAFIPPTATFANIQYRLWSDEPNIPLIIRLAINSSGAGMQELSGPSGVATQLVTEKQRFNVSLSHPKTKYELIVLGYKFER